MKKIYKLFFAGLLSLIFIQSASAQVPATFRDYLRSLYPSCYTSDGAGGWVIDPNCPDILQVDSLNVQGVFSSSAYEYSMITVVDLEYFTAMKYLNLSDNKISQINAFPPALEKLVMTNTHTEGPMLGPYFTSFPSTLLYINIDSCYKKPTIPALPPGLKYLNCAHNKLDSLPALPSGLDTLICSNQLNYEETYPMFPALPALPASLKYLDCHANSLTSLPALPASLTYLDCSNQWAHGSYPGAYYQSLTSLPALPASLQYFDCQKNAINSIPALPASLLFLNCSGSRFNSPDYGGVNEGIGFLSQLPSHLQTLDCSNSNMNCIPYLPASLSTITFCSPVSNNIQCGRGATVTGAVYYDANSNGVKDAGEPYCRNIAVNLSNGLTSYTNDSGYYFLNAFLGTYTLNVSAASYLTVNPASISYSFATYDTTVTASIGLMPIATYDSVNIQIIPSAYRPQFSNNLIVKYENVGTAPVNANVVVRYDPSRLYYENSSDNNVTRVGNELRLQVNNLLPHVPEFFVANFVTSAPLNDTIITYGTISSAANTCHDSVITIVTGSHDPNDKSATPVMSTSQVQQGAYINYLIHFQNSGTDTAFNIVITDTLSSQLDSTSFQMLGTSHFAKNKLTGNKLYVEFPNILLPDSNRNEKLSHGYIMYRVKPVSSVAYGTNIPNQASIYFDYNEPVQTNIANTKIATPSVVFTTYNFIGDGEWSNPANWQGGVVPPALISTAIQINIMPVNGGQCLVNVPVNINNQSSLTVVTGAKLVVQGNLQINQH